MHDLQWSAGAWLAEFGSAVGYCAALLEEAGVALTPGDDFDAVHGPESVRLSFAAGPDAVHEALERIAELASLVDVPIQVDGGVGEDNARAVREAGASLLVAGSAVFADASPADAYRRLVVAAGR